MFGAGFRPLVGFAAAYHVSNLLPLADRVPPRVAIRARADFGSLLCKSGSLAVEAASCASASL